jgi:hypothetical protein
MTASRAIVCATGNDVHTLVREEQLSRQEAP